MNTEREVPATKAPEALPIDPEERLDWDFCLESPPARPRGVVKVRLVYRGRSKPLPVPDPDDEVS